MNDLADLCVTTEVVTEATFAMNDRFYPIPSSPQFATPRGMRSDLVRALSQALYTTAYCNFDVDATAISSDTRLFMESLSRANNGTGSWDHGWTFIQFDGFSSLVRKFEVTFRVDGRHVRPVDGTTPLENGSPCQVATPKEWRYLFPGHYLVLGNQGHVDFSRMGHGIVRVYVNTPSDTAALFIETTTRLLNDVGIPFLAKVLRDPRLFVRSDPAVIYMRHDDFHCYGRLLIEEMTVTLSRHLRESTPRFTRRIGSGIAFAVDPGNGESFGQHRCRLLAEALFAAYRSGATSAATRWDLVVSYFQGAGVDPWNPYRPIDSHDCCAAIGL